MLNQTYSVMILTGGGILTVVLVLFAGVRKTSRGEWYWVGWSCAVTASITLFMFRGPIPPLFSVVVGNLLFIFGLMMNDAGLRTFESRSVPWLLYGVSIVPLAALLLVFTYWIPSYSTRVVFIGIATATFAGLVAYRLFHGFRDLPSGLRFILGSDYALIAAFFAYRVIVELVDPSADPIGRGAGATAVYVMYVLAMGAWTLGSIGFIILKNQSLHSQAERELARRTIVQAKLESSTERLMALHDVYERILSIEPLAATAEFALSRLDHLARSRGGLVVQLDGSEATATVIASTFGGMHRPEGRQARLCFESSEEQTRWLEDLGEELPVPDDYRIIDAVEHPLLAPFAAQIGSDAPPAFLLAPMRVGEELYGALLLGVDDAAAVAAVGLEGGAPETILDVAYALSLAAHNAAVRRQLTTHARELETSLAQKEVLLREVHHRVKNNLQLVYSLLFLQSSGIRNAELVAVLKELQNRVRSIVFVHERLYRSATPAQIRFTDYVRDFVSHLALSFGVMQDRVRIHVDQNDALMDADIAVPLGLIINEIVSNSLKYAFPDGREGEIRISLSRSQAGAYVLTLSDNGVGMPETRVPTQGPHIGLEIVATLVSQIHATYTVNGTNGTTITLVIPTLHS